MLLLSSHLPSIRTLQCFLAVAQECNFRSAAQLLNMSQPPLTRQIQGLEDLLRVKLIERDTRRVSLTAAGEAFRAEAHHIVSALSAAVATMKACGQDDTPRIGLTSVLNCQAIGALDRLLGDHVFTGARGVERDMSRHLVERVRSGALDLALVGDIAPPAPDLLAETVGSEAMVAMLPAGHAAAAGAVAALEKLGETALFWFSRSDNPAFYDKCERAFRACGLGALRRAEPRDFSVLLAAVAAGDGIALCPQSMQATSRVGVVYRPLPPVLARLLAIELQVVVRADDMRPALLEKIATIRTALAGTQAPIPRMPSTP